MWRVAFVQGGQAPFHQKGCRHPHLVKSQGFAVYLRLRHTEKCFEPDGGAVGSAGGSGYQSVAGVLLASFRVAPQVQEPLRLQLTGARQAVEVPPAEHEVPLQLAFADQVVQIGTEPEAGTAPLCGEVLRADQIALAPRTALVHPDQ